jgi:sec-independent protein translocase protein TatB
MFGMGGSEILVILVVALLFLGPDKLPQAAKQISKGIRDLKKQSRSLQQQIENDENIGGAIRDLKSALRGDDIPVRPKPIRKPKPKALPEGAAGEVAETAAVAATAAEPPEPATEASLENATPGVTLPPVAGEPAPEVPEALEAEDDLGKMIRPAAGTVAKGSEPKHG